MGTRRRRLASGRIVGALAALAVVGLTVTAVAVTALAPSAEARTLCGRVQSGGRPVQSASVLATGEGAYAKTDSSGLFCLTDLEAEVHKLQIFALGFSPVERYLPASRPETLLVELVPLRTLSSAGLSPSKVSPPPAPSPRPALDVVLELPEYVTREDSLRLARAPKDAFERSLQRIHALLSNRELADSVSRRGSWRDVAEYIRLLPGPEISDDAAANREVVAIANYLLQAACVAWARAAVLEDDRESASEARRALRRRLGGIEAAYTAWMARIEARLPR